MITLPYGLLMDNNQNCYNFNKQIAFCEKIEIYNNYEIKLYIYFKFKKKFNSFRKKYKFSIILGDEYKYKIILG